MSELSHFRSVFRPDLFAGKTCLVTGGGSGIGRAVAVELISLGAANVVIASRSAKRIEAAAAELRDIARQCQSKTAVHAAILNIRDEGNVEAVVTDLTTRFGRIDCLVNNGGGQFASPAEMIKPKGWRAVIDTNLNGTWFMCQALFNITPPERRKGLSIVNVIADYFNGFPMMAHTGAARAAVDNLTRTLCLEWGSYGVRINSVAPGIILSSGVDNYPAEFRSEFFSTAFDAPLQRAGTESETSSAIVFLLSPAAAYISGATLRVDGGRSLSKPPMRKSGDVMDQLRLAEEVTQSAAGSQSAAPAPYHVSAILARDYEARELAVMQRRPQEPTSRL